MDKWLGKVAVVTGANSGIGLAVTKELLENRLRVVALDKNIDNLKEISVGTTVNNNTQTGFYVRQVDLLEEEQILESFKWIDETLGGPDILLNIAGVGGRTSLMEGTVEEWKLLLGVNVVGLCLCCQQAAKSMRRRNLNNAHIINLSSNTTWYTPKEGFLHFYTASKHAVRSLTQSFRLELLDTNIKVSCISPGLVKTGIFTSSLGEKGDHAIFSSLPHLQPEDIASSIVYLLSSPSHVQVGELNIKHEKSLV